MVGDALKHPSRWPWTRIDSTETYVAIALIVAAYTNRQHNRPRNSTRFQYECTSSCADFCEMLTTCRISMS